MPRNAEYLTSDLIFDRFVRFFEIFFFENLKRSYVCRLDRMVEFITFTNSRSDIQLE